MTLRHAGDLLLLFGWALPAIGAPLEYLFVRGDDGRRLGFRHSALGRHLMAYMAAVGLLAALGVLRLLTDDGPLWAALRVVAGLVLAFVTWWRWRVVHQARVAADREHAGPLAP